MTEERRQFLEAYQRGLQAGWTGRWAKRYEPGPELVERRLAAATRRYVAGEIDLCEFEARVEDLLGLRNRSARCPVFTGEKATTGIEPVSGSARDFVHENR